MEKQQKSLALQYDLFVNSVLKFLDTTTEKDYMLKLTIINELSNKVNESEADKITIKNALEAAQDECSKLSYKLKTSARLLDEVQVEKENLEREKQTLKSQLAQLYNVFKKPDSIDTTQSQCLIHSKRSDHVQLDEKKILDNTDALLSDLSYSHSEDSSYENVEISKPIYTRIKKQSASHVPNDVNTKTCQIKNVNINNGQIIATTTLTMDLGCVSANSVIKTNQKQISETSLVSSSSDSVKSISSSESVQEERKCKNSDIIDSVNIEKKHNFVEKIIVIPEICYECHKKIKFNTKMVKCLECKTIAHLECKSLIPMKCTLDQNKINALNRGIPPLIIHCISEIEKRGLDTIGVYRVSGSDKEVKNLREQFRKTVPNLNSIDIHVLCSCLKEFIREQKNRLISEKHFLKLADVLKNNDKVSKLLSQIILEFPSSSRNILAFLILHLQKVASSPKCCMDYNCLSIVFGPTIVGLSTNSLVELNAKSEQITKVVIELLKLSRTFWLNILNTDVTSSDELLHSTPARIESRSPGSSAHRFFSSGLKRRILDSPRKNKIAKQVEFEKKC